MPAFRTERAPAALALPLAAMLLTAASACAPRRVETSAGGAVASAAAAASASDGPNQLSDAERAAGWRLLFDGSTLGGWRGLGRDGVPAAHWVVEGGAIKKIASGKVPVQADGQPMEGGDLMTEASYGDFELAWQWKVTPGANSGVKYNVSEQLSTSIAPRHAAKGFEYQVIDDDRHADGKIVKHQTADLYDLIAANDRKRVRPVGEWNDSRILFRGNHGEHWLNGQKVVEFDLGTPAMDAALAASKYRGWSWFGERRRGHIVLQDHNDEVYFRSIKLRELDRSAP